MSPTAYFLSVLLILLLYRAVGRALLEASILFAVFRLWRKGRSLKVLALAMSECREQIYLDVVGGSPVPLSYWLWPLWFWSAHGLVFSAVAKRTPWLLSTDDETSN